MIFTVEKEPSQNTIAQIVAIAQDYTADYFTENVPADVRNDLLFQRAACLWNDGEMVSFLVFTCLDGCPHITLFATKRAYRGQGYGKILMDKFVAYLDEMGLRTIELMTVMPKSKPVYFSTVAFYQNVGFVITDTYPTLWESGAIKLKKTW